MLTNWNIAFWEYEFFAPHWLWLLCFVPILLFFAWRNEKKRKGEFKFSRTTSDQQMIGSPWIRRLRELNLLIYGVIAALLIVALAKPFHWSMYNEYDRDYKEGIDIIITMDVSGSMLARDFNPDRLQAAKRVAKEFIDGRKGDRIGLVAYAGEAYTACPPTLDYTILKKQIDLINDSYLEGGTAIGLGLGTAVNRLRSDSLVSKVIILLTDGMDGGLEIHPLKAAELAKAKNIRVYTIGVGSNGMAPTPVMTPFGMIFENDVVEIDEQVLKQIASITGGQYFRATDEKSLKNIYDEINKLETRRMEDLHFKSEPPAYPQGFLNWAFALTLISWLFNYLIFKQHD